MRATLDLDDPATLDVVTAWHGLAEHGDGHVHGRVSASGEGVHLKVHGVEPELVRELRLRLGDDRRRMAFDEMSELKPRQILFSRKPTGPAGEWTDELDRLVEQYERTAPWPMRYPGAP